MKIQNLHIHHNQFKKLDLDLTYPKGHPKAGKALDKVCIIGQSGTGKTTLLRLIKKLFFYFNNNLPSNTSEKYNAIRFAPNEVATVCLEDKLGRLLYRSVGANDSREIAAGGLAKDYPYNFKNEEEKAAFENQPMADLGLFFPAGIPHYSLTNSPSADVNSIKNDVQNNLYRVAELDFVYGNNTSLKEAFPSYFEFGSADSPFLWNAMHQNIKKYQEDEFNFRVQLTKKVEKSPIDIKEEIKIWQSKNPNPLESLAQNCLDKILKEFHLQTKTSIDTVSEIESIQVKLLNSEKTIPYQELSTGIRQIIFTAFPIYSLLKENSIVLMDEPETSLYPDLQRKIIPYYTSFDKTNGEDCQFFFATHSPIIASSFEPWEIVELKFNEEGFVYREEYWEKENHVDNYKYFPQYLRWDAILQHIFDLEEDGNDMRKGLLQEFSMLDNKLKHRKRKGDKISKEDPEVKELLEMGKKLGWNIQKGNIT